MHWSRTAPIALVAALIGFALPVTAAARSSGILIILDVTDPEGTPDRANRAFVFGLDTKLTGSSSTLYNDLDSAIGSGGTARDSLLQLIRQPREQSSRRWISDKGDMAFVFTFMPNNYDLDLKIEEKARETQFSSDVATLFKAVATKLVAPGKTTLSKTVWRLEKTRAILTIQAGSKGTERTSGPPKDGGESQPAKQPQTAGVSLTTGPPEHWYLSVSVPLTTTKEFRYMETSGTLEPREKPKRFLVGANFLVGDVLSESHKVYGGLALGVVVEASSNPFDSFGVTVSYRLPRLTALGLGFDLVTPFWGLIRSTSDARTASGAVERDARSVLKCAVGMSLNIDKVASWL